jgi:hypothetical protein
LKLNRDQLSWIVGLFRGHCHLKRHRFILELTDDPTCERCLEEDESASPSDYYDAPINKVLHFIRSVGLMKG